MTPGSARIQLGAGSSTLPATPVRMKRSRDTYNITVSVEERAEHGCPRQEQELASCFATQLVHFLQVEQFEVLVQSYFVIAGCMFSPPKEN